MRECRPNEKITFALLRHSFLRIVTSRAEQKDHEEDELEMFRDFVITASILILMTLEHQKNHFEYKVFRHISYHRYWGSFYIT